MSQVLVLELMSPVLFANIIIIIRTMTDLGDIVRELKPTVLIGAAAIPKVS